MEQPRERLARLGPNGLADVEILALLLGTGQPGKNATALAAGILQRAGGLRGLARLTPYELARLEGIGPARAARLCAAFELATRTVEAVEAGAPLSDSRAVYRRYGGALRRSPVERFLVVAVDAKNRPCAEREVARGGRTRCLVDPAEVFRVLITHSASGAIFVHNHPSGDPAPSADDLALTERLLAVGELLEIRILDHLIIGDGCYISLRDAGIWPTKPQKS